MKTFPDKQPLRESVASRYPLQEIIEGVLSLKANDLGWYSHLHEKTQSTDKGNTLIMKYSFNAYSPLLTYLKSNV